MSTMIHDGKTYISIPNDTDSCDGCVFQRDGTPGVKFCDHPHGALTHCEYAIWVEAECCGQPNTCEQPCFHQSGRTTPGNPGVIASVPQSLAEVHSSDGWPTWGGSVMPVTGKISPALQYDPRDASFNPLDKQVGGNHYRDNSAPSFLREAISVMEQRGQQYDQSGGERSFEKAAKVFNAIAGTDHLSASDIALVLLAVKLVRDQSREEPHRDSLLDAVAYASLYGEARLMEGA